MGGFVKLYSTILQSSVWLEDAATRVLWITMLAMADRRGIVEASVGGLAHAANIGRDECERGLATLAAPDPDSKSKRFAGRRVKSVNGGWLILNYKLYRELRTEEQVAAATRKAAWRNRKRVNDVFLGHVPGQTGQSTMSHAEAASEADSSSPTSTARERLLSKVPERGEWEIAIQRCAASPEQVERGAAEFLADGREPKLALFIGYVTQIVRRDATPPKAATRSPRRSHSTARAPELRPSKIMDV